MGVNFNVLPSEELAPQDCYHTSEHARSINYVVNDCACAEINRGEYRLIFPPQYDGSRPVYYFCYEEMVELMNAGRKSTEGAEALEDMKQKAEIVFDALPETDY